MKPTDQDVSFYATLVSTALALLSLLFLLFPQSKAVFEFGILACALIAGSFLFVLLSNPRSVRFGWFLSASLLFFYGGSTAYPVWESKIFGGPIASFQQHYKLWSEGVVLVLVACALLGFVGSICERAKLPRVGGPLEKPHRLIIYGIVAGTGLLYVVGELSFQGIVNQTGESISPLASLAMTMCAPTAGWAAYNFFEADQIGVKGAMLVSSIFLLLYLVPVGRRSVFFGVITVGLGSFMSTKNALRRMAFTHKAVFAISVAGFIYVSSFFFLAMRFAGHQLPDTEVTLTRRMSEAYELVVKQPEVVSDQLQKNVRYRSSVIIQYLSEISSTASADKIAYGDVATGALITAVPSVLLNSPKRSLLDEYSEQTFVNRRFGLEDEDKSNTVLTAGVVDFGILGGILYPVVLLSLYIGFWEIASPLVSSPLRILIFLSFVDRLLRIESILASYFVHPRNLLLAIGLMVAFLSLYSFLTKQESKPDLQLRQA